MLQPEFEPGVADPRNSWHMRRVAEDIEHTQYELWLRVQDCWEFQRLDGADRRLIARLMVERGDRFLSLVKRGAVRYEFDAER